MTIPLQGLEKKTKLVMMGFKGDEMFFKQRVPFKKAFTLQCDFVFTKEYEDIFDFIRKEINDPKLNAVDKNIYYDHMRSLYFELLVICITKTQKRDITYEAHRIRDEYLESKNQSQLIELMRLYNQAFGSSFEDGFIPMVHTFFSLTIGETPNETAFEEIYNFLCATIAQMFRKIKKIKLLI